MTIEDKSKEAFDGNKARQIRLSLGLRTADLARQLTEDLPVPESRVAFYSLSVRISRLENGREIPQGIERGKRTLRYLGWLKDHGYNPLGLED